MQEQRKLRQQASVDRQAGERVAGRKVQSKRARNWQKMALLLRHYWHRLAGAALGWFAWDFYYCAPLVAQSNAWLILAHLEVLGHGRLSPLCISKASSVVKRAGKQGLLFLWSTPSRSFAAMGSRPCDADCAAG